MLVACILYVEYHYLSQHHGGLVTSSRSEEHSCWQLSFFLLLFAFACTYCMAGLYGALVGLGSEDRIVLEPLAIGRCERQGVATRALSMGLFGGTIVACQQPFMLLHV